MRLVRGRVSAQHGRRPARRSTSLRLDEPRPRGPTSRAARLARRRIQTPLPAKTRWAWRGAAVLRRNAAVALGNELDRADGAGARRSLGGDPILWCARGRLGARPMVPAKPGRVLSSLARRGIRGVRGRSRGPRSFWNPCPAATAVRAPQRMMMIRRTCRFSAAPPWFSPAGDARPHPPPRGRSQRCAAARERGAQVLSGRPDRRDRDARFSVHQPDPARQGLLQAARQDGGPVPVRPGAGRPAQEGRGPDGAARRVAQALRRHADRPTARRPASNWCARRTAASTTSTSRSTTDGDRHRHDVFLQGRGRDGFVHAVLRQIGGNYVVKTQTGKVDIPHYNADVNSTFSNYKINVPVPDSVFTS